MSVGPTWVVVTHAMLPNGASHRLAQALLHDGHDVAFCAMPLPGASRWRAERMLPGARTPEVLVDEPRPVPPLRELRSAAGVVRFAWQVAKSGCREIVLVGCDPVSFLQAVAAFRSAPVRVRASAVWFVDWSAQRLQHPTTAAAYRLVTRTALRLADVTAAISPEAAEAMAGVTRPRRNIVVLANQALHVGTGPAWAERPLSVAYVGGLSQHQGVDVLLGAAAVLGREGVAVDIVGDGPANRTVLEAVANLSGVRFHGMVGDVGGLADVLLSARVGWALYDSGFPQYSFGDSLKTKDYLAAGMRVVSTLPRSADNGVIGVAQCSVPAVVEATRQALVQPPPSDPIAHPLLVDAKRSLQTFVSAVCAVR
ncbi:MAG: glycosyltransferase [Actinomycetota bacterium]|jgi:glycosyltransferase involved in cell wall biosynthesis|nr:glycosyltransferase [Actinomycetota bacterium]